MTACMPLMLLSSIPMMLQADVSDSASLKLAEDQRPASSLSNRGSIVDTQPPSNATAAPVYRRFSTYERRAKSITNSLVALPSQDRETNLSNRKRKAKSVPVDLRFTSEHESWVGDKQSGKAKGKEKQRASGLEVSIPDLRANCNPESIVVHELKATPRRCSSEPSHSDIDCSAAGPSYFSLPRKLELPSAVFPSPQLETLDEDTELQTPVVPTIPSLLSLSKTNTAHENDSHHGLDSITPTSSCRSLKRVSFCSGANEVIPHLETFTNESSQNQQPSTWASMLFMNAGPSSRPLLVRQTSLPSVRGQAARRSILKRTSSFGDYTLREKVQEIKPHFKTDLAPASDTSPIHSTKLPDDRTAQELSSKSPWDDSSRTDLLCDAVQATVHKAQTIVVLPARPRKTKTVLTREERTVRHWSMEGSQWTRRSGIYASPRASQHRMPERPSAPKIPVANRA